MRREKIISSILAFALIISVVNPVGDMGIIKVEASEPEMEEWEYTGISVSKDSPQPVNTDTLTVRAEVTGETENLQYKFVWMKDNWSKWGVLRDFSMNEEAEWNPKEVGQYKLYVDVKDENNNIESKSIVYEITDIVWTTEGTLIQPNERQKIGNRVTLNAQASGNTKGLQYKYVWMKDNWAEWGVLRDFSENPEAEWFPEETGTYKIYTDIKDWYGKITTSTQEYNVVTDLWTYEGVNTDVPTPQEKYVEPIKITADTTGETGNLQYKFVWMKNSWKEWGVIQNYSENAEAEWYPQGIGSYKIYVDVKDADSRTETKVIPYEITKVNWNYDSVELSPSDVQKKGEEVSIRANTSGTTEGLKYKYVWMKDNWSKWGVIQDFTTDSTVVWNTPKEAGEYKVYVDVKDRDGEIRTKTAEYYLATQIWKHEGVNVNEGEPEQIYTELPVVAETSGENEGLQYKYVWMKDNWSEWGVIKEFSNEKEATWYPKKPGTYKIYSDIKDQDGRIQTKIQEYEVLDAPWKLDSLSTGENTSYFVGDEATVTASTSGENEGLQYKFVVRYGDDWNDWKVLQDFSENNTVNVDIKKEGNITVYVDIKDQRGVVFDPYTLQLKGHIYSSAGASPNRVSIGKNTLIYPNVTGSTDGMKCKYVWMKDNWSKWGVIREFSGATSVVWTPSEEGRYYVYVDVELNGVIRTETVIIEVNDILAKLEEIKQYTYVPYKIGGRNPEGWDCSGFTKWAMAYLGVSIPNTSREQALIGKYVNTYDMSEWQEGDLIFYSKAGQINHVALYLGDGMMMHAINTKYNTQIISVEAYALWDRGNKLTCVKRYLL